MEIPKTIYNICMQEGLAIGNNNFLLYSYIKFLFNDINTIYNLHCNFTNRIKCHPEIRDYAHISFIDENDNTYELIIQTDSYYQNHFDNSIINFDILFIEFDKDNNIIKKQKIESDKNIIYDINNLIESDSLNTMKLIRK